MPVADFEERYGKIPTGKTEQAERERLKGYLATGKFNAEAQLYKMTLDERIFYSQRIDFKIQPDVWFERRDKLLLAEPNGHVRVRNIELHKREKTSS
jgi:hypothetical protein